MRLKRIHAAAKKTIGKHRAPDGGRQRRPLRGRPLRARRRQKSPRPEASRSSRPRRRWRLLPAPLLAAALVIGYLATMASHSATPAGDHATAAQPLAPLGTGVVDPAVKPYLATKQLEAVTVGPQRVSGPVRMVLTSSRVTTALDDSGIPAVAEAAYQRAATVLEKSNPGCHLPWELLAAIGRVESNHGRFGGSMLLANGDGTRPIRGIPLDGRANVALVRDTDGGTIDGDPNFDRAVGPMQFLPSTWLEYAVDGNGDGKRDPNNIFDASLGAAAFLCSGGPNLADPTQEAAAIRRYNNADEYVRVVLALAASYAAGDAATLPMTDAVDTPAPEAGVPGVPGVLPQAGTDAGSVPGVEPGTGLPPQLGPTLLSPSAGGHTREPAAKTARHTQPRTGVRTLTPTPAHAQAPTPAKKTVRTSTRTPAPTSTPTPMPTSMPTTSMPTTPTPTSPSVPTPSPTSSAPTQTPTTAPTQTPSPSGDPTATPTPTDTTGSSQAPVPSQSATPGADKNVNIGWAPAMRQVVVKLLTAPKAPTGSSTDSGTHRAPVRDGDHRRVPSPGDSTTRGRSRDSSAEGSTKN